MGADVCPELQPANVAINRHHHCRHRPCLLPPSFGLSARLFGPRRVVKQKTPVLLEDEGYIPTRGATTIRLLGST